MLWTIEADRTWNYVNRALVYLAFLVLGLALGTMRRAPRVSAGWVAGVAAGGVGWGAAAKIFPRFLAGTRGGARLDSPLGSSEVFPPLARFALPPGLWV